MTVTRKNLVAAGVAVFVLALVLTFPARVAYRWFVPATIQLSGISGTVWSGSADALAAGGLFLRDVEWRIKPLLLLTARLGYAIEGKPASGFLETVVSVGFGGTVVLSDLSASLPLSVFESAASMPGLRGTASVRITELRLRDGLPVTIEGKVSIDGLLAPKVDPSPIGAYEAEFFTAEEGIVASVQDTDRRRRSRRQPDDRAGSKLSVPRPGSLPTTGRRRDSGSRCAFWGSPDERGQHQIRLEGTL